MAATIESMCHRSGMNANDTSKTKEKMKMFCEHKHISSALWMRVHWFSSAIKRWKNTFNLLIFNGVMWVKKEIFV